MSSTSTSRTAFMQSLRWGVWSPLQGASGSPAEAVCLPLQGGALPNPCGVMVYSTPTQDQNSDQGRDVEEGVIRFRFSSGPAVPAKSRQEVASQQKLLSPSQGESNLVLPASPSRSPQGPGLSISQLAATSRYPTMSHSTASPWQQQLPSQLYPSPLASAHQLSHVERPGASSIAHLEVDLSGAAVEEEEEGGAGEGGQSPGRHQLQELTYTPVHAPVIALGTQAAGSMAVSSRASLAHLFSAGFPDILDRNNQVAEVLDPSEPVNFDPQREEADRLQSNTLILQFLAFSRVPQAGVNSDWPKSIYFTFQFYRFPPVTTQRLTLLSPDEAETKPGDNYPCILALINKDGTVNSGSPGLQLHYPVEPGFLKAGERPWFLRYLALHSLQVDVWDSESLLLIGSAAVEFKHMLRQGRPAVQVAHQLEVITTEYLQDASLVRSPAPPINVFTTVKGRLHLRLGNVGGLAKKSPNNPQDLPPSRTRIIQACDGTRGFGGGSLSSKSVLNLNVRNAWRAQRLADVDGDLAALLHSRAGEGHVAPGQGHSHTDHTHQRKMQRMAAVRRLEEQGHVSAEAKPNRRREEREQHSRDLRLIEAYRERSKVEGITNMLSKAITTQHTVYATLGTAEFFEFVLKNPFNVPQTVSIESDDPELSVIVNGEEWRHFKTLTNTLTPLEEGMFQLKDVTSAPRVYLRPKESVHIPLKYQTFICDHAVPAQGPSSLRSGASPQVAQKRQSNTVRAKSIKVAFQAEDGKPLAICQVNVEPTPHVIDQTFRFYQPELTFLKKAVRLPPWEDLPGAAGDTADAWPPVRVRCSDPNVICDTRKLAPGEPQDVFLKVAGGPSPQIKKFFITVFTDHWLSTPAQTWQVYVHFMQRVDLSCVSGQVTWQSLVLRGTQAVRRVRCYTSHPLEVQMDPEGVFVLPPNAVQDLQVGVRPQRSGSRFVYLNVVDVEHRQLVASWLLCLTCRQPLISKAFEIFVPVGGGRGSNKKITYTNPYPTSRTLRLRSDHPDLLQFKEDNFQIEGGESYTIGLRFAPTQSPGMEEILIYINNHEDKNEETFCVKVQYK